jgi:4-amino-4-deoxy-L-arabinose transferase-like glycosyltransferase
LKNGFSTRGQLVGILALATLLRLLQLDLQPLWWDEGYSVFFATRAFGDMLARTAVDIHPPLYYALMQLWMAAFGKDAVTLRLLSVALGVAALPLLYLIGKKLFDTRVARVAALLLAIAPLHIYYSQELRMYGMVTLLALASVALQLQLLHVPRSTFHVSSVLYVLSTVLLLHTQYFAAFLIAAQIAVVLYLKWRARWGIKLREWMVRWLLVGALALPWVLYAGPKLYVYVTQKVGIEQYTRLDPLTYLAQHLTAFSIGHVSEWPWLAWGAVVFVLAALFGVVAVGRRQKAESRNSKGALSAYSLPLTAFYLWIPLLLGFLVNLVYPFHPIRYERLLLFAAPFFLLLVARGGVALFERQRALGLTASALIVALCALSLYDFYTVARYPDEDYRPLIAEMQQDAAPHDLVYAVYPWQIGYLEAYYRGAALKVYETPSDAWIKQPDAMSQEIARLRRENARAWVLAYQKQGHLIEDRLTNEYSNDYLITDQTFGNTRLEYFVQGNATDFELAPIVFNAELILRLNYAAFDPPTGVPNLALARFGWNTTTDAYSYSLRVTAAAGNKIAQQDAPIPHGATTMRRALVLPKQLAPGEYTLRLVVYRRADGTPQQTPDGADDVALTKITVAP